MKNTLTSPKDKIPGSAWINVTARAITSANLVRLNVFSVIYRAHLLQTKLFRVFTMCSALQPESSHHFNNFSDFLQSFQSCFLIFFVYAMNIQGPQSPFPFDEKLLYKLVN